VGQYVALTAAHCVEEQEVGEDTELIIPLLRTGRPVQGKCERHPWFSVDDRADLALCVFEGEFRADEIEKVSTIPTRLTKGTRLIFSGNGCKLRKCGGQTSAGSGGEPKSGRFRVLTPPRTGDPTFMTVGRSLLGESSYCFGDSGGPVCTKDGQWLVGIGQSTCVDDKRWKSLVTNLSEPATVQWMCEWFWMDEEKREIEGLDCPRPKKQPAS
jgi:hypothetical protein